MSIQRPNRCVRVLIKLLVTCCIMWEKNCHIKICARQYSIFQRVYMIRRWLSSTRLCNTCAAKSNFIFCLFKGSCFDKKMSELDIRPTLLNSTRIKIYIQLLKYSLNTLLIYSLNTQKEEKDIIETIGQIYSNLNPSNDRLWMDRQRWLAKVWEL